MRADLDSPRILDLHGALTAIRSAQGSSFSLFVWIRYDLKGFFSWETIHRRNSVSRVPRMSPQILTTAERLPARTPVYVVPMFPHLVASQLSCTEYQPTGHASHGVACRQPRPRALRYHEESIVRGGWLLLKPRRMRVRGPKSRSRTGESDHSPLACR